MCVLFIKKQPIQHFYSNASFCGKKTSVLMQSISNSRPHSASATVWDFLHRVSQASHQLAPSRPATPPLWHLGLQKTSATKMQKANNQKKFWAHAGSDLLQKRVSLLAVAAPQWAVCVRIGASLHLTKRATQPVRAFQTRLARERGRSGVSFVPLTLNYKHNTASKKSVMCVHTQLHVRAIVIQ